MSPLRVAIVDDHQMFRAGLAAVLAAAEDVELVGEGESADDAVRLAVSAQPDVILLDVRLPGGGLNALRHIASTGRHVTVIMLTASESGEDVVSAVACGAAGYLLKGIKKSQLIRALRMASQGKTIIDQNLAVRIVQRAEAKMAVGSASSKDLLTPREQDVIELIARGLSNTEIGLLLGLSPRSVRNCVTRLMAKMNVRNRLEAALAHLRDKGAVADHQHAMPQ